ncbi:MAG: hypothetical protein FJ271_02985 [Planctomycetes bacterium]|nr:hypothetical protein [Planctomycetota bacterium]
MTGRIRLVAVAGLLMLGFVGFYPPLKRPPVLGGELEIGSTKEWPFGQRALVFIDDYVYLYRTPNQLAGQRTEIDAARLLGEALVILAATGIAILLLWPGAHRQAT